MSSCSYFFYFFFCVEFRSFELLRDVIFYLQNKPTFIKTHARTRVHANKLREEEERDNERERSVKRVRAFF